MTDVDRNRGGCLPREQLETALRFLEWSHGDALRRPWSDEAHAYYEAIDILEAALDEELRPPNELPRLGDEEQLIEQSRKAREEGYAAATLLDERYGKSEARTPGMLTKVREKVNRLRDRLD